MKKLFTILLILFLFGCKEKKAIELGNSVTGNYVVQKENILAAVSARLAKVKYVLYNPKYIIVDGDTAWIEPMYEPSNIRVFIPAKYNR